MIHIVTDSSCDLPAALVEELSISVVPLTIRFGDEEFVDQVELSADAFWTRLTAGDGLPETAAPSAGSFLEAFDHCEAAGAEGVLCVTLSSALSASHQAAAIAAEKSQLPVKVLDSRSVSTGLGLQVLAAADHARTGAALEDVSWAAAGKVDGVTVIAALDTIEFLKRGGRMGAASALVAGLLEIKPIIGMRDGAIEGVGRVRTRSKAVERIVTECVSRAGTGRLSMFGGRTEGFGSIVARVEAETGETVLATELGAVVGTHSGPGVLGMAHLPH